MLIDILWILLLLALGVQLFYILVIFGRLSFFYRNKISYPTLDPEGVTVVIAAHNEKENLRKLIPILCKQQYANFDILIINDRSTDGTKKMLENMLGQYPKLRTVTVKYTPGHVTPKKYALTLGIKVAKNDVLLLTDADCIPKSEFWIEKMTEPVRLQDKKFALGFSQYQDQKGLLGNWIQFETIWTALQYFSFALWSSPYMGVGRNLCYRKSFFLEKYAFQGIWHILGGDDDLFVNKHANGKNTAVVIDPESITLSEPKRTWSSYVTQKKRHFQAGKYYKSGDKQKLGVYAFSHFLFWATAIALVVILGLNQKWEQFTLILGILVIRAILLTSVITSARKKLEGKSKMFWAWFFDLMYLGYFWILGTLGHQSKKVKWK